MKPRANPFTCPTTAPSGTFSLDANALRIIKEKTKKRSKAKSRKFIKSKYAEHMLDAVPEPGDEGLFVTQGNFIFGDVLPFMFERFGKIDRLLITTLSMSERNVQTLSGMLERGQVGNLNLWVSTYWVRTDKQKVPFRAREEFARYGGRVKFESARIHAKIIVARTVSARNIVIEGSANLRSCDTIEQVSIFDCAERADFHEEWTAQINGDAINAE